MNTPSHVAASLLIGGRQPRWSAVCALTLGALLPDLPMFGFYGYQKWAQRSEREIWSTLYFEESWQLFFDGFNSIPLGVLLILVCWRAGFQWGFLFSTSAVLHMLCDLPVHHDDGHRHFLPFSDFRYASPVSYWDPRHYGWLFAPAELIFAIAACGWTILKSRSKPLTIVATTTLSFYLLAIVLVIAVWTTDSQNATRAVDGPDTNASEVRQRAAGHSGDG